MSKGALERRLPASVGDDPAAEVPSVVADPAAGRAGEAVGDRAEARAADRGEGPGPVEVDPALERLC